MKREVFKGKAFRGLPKGLINGFMYGCFILLIAVVLGMDEDMFVPLLGVAVILGSIIGIISGIGKRIEADENGIYLKNREYLFAENDMYMQVYTHYYSFIPVTERYIVISGKDRKRELKCSFLGGQDAGRLAMILESGMKKKYSTEYDSTDHDDGAVQYFIIPVADMTEKIDKRNRLLVKIMFWFLTVVFSWILISMIIQDQLEDYGIGLIFYMALNAMILGGVNFFMCRKFKKSAQKIPCKVVFSDGQCYIDGRSFRGTDITRVVMTPGQGPGNGDIRKLVFYDKTGKNSEYNFGFRGDRHGFPGYGRLVEAVKDSFGDKFAYDIN
jgi:hypothetical protein